MYHNYTDNIKDLINFCKERERKYYSSLASVQALQKSKTKITTINNFYLFRIQLRDRCKDCFGIRGCMAANYRSIKNLTSHCV